MNQFRGNRFKILLHHLTDPPTRQKRTGKREQTGQWIQPTGSFNLPSQIESSNNSRTGGTSSSTSTNNNARSCSISSQPTCQKHKKLTVWRYYQRRSPHPSRGPSIRLSIYPSIGPFSILGTIYRTIYRTIHWTIGRLDDITPQITICRLPHGFDQDVVHPDLLPILGID